MSVTLVNIGVALVLIGSGSGSGNVLSASTGGDGGNAPEQSVSSTFTYGSNSGGMKVLH